RSRRRAGRRCRRGPSPRRTVMALAGVILGGVYIVLFIIAIILILVVGVSGGFDSTSNLLSVIS
ncbi:hypothetical protein P1N98_07595, partial [Tsukamurella tyrosinosolvens]